MKRFRVWTSDFSIQIMIRDPAIYFIRAPCQYSKFTLTCFTNFYPTGNIKNYKFKLWTRASINHRCVLSCFRSYFQHRILAPNWTATAFQQCSKKTSPSSTISPTMDLKTSLKRPTKAEVLNRPSRTQITSTKKIAFPPIPFQATPPILSWKFNWPWTHFFKNMFVKINWSATTCFIVWWISLFQKKIMWLLRCWNGFHR